MTTYVLALTGDEAKAAIVTRWTRFGQARLISVSRSARHSAGADNARIVIPMQASADRCQTSRRQDARDPQALAALLLRTLDAQDGLGVVVADFDNEEFAADVVARIAALGRAVTCSDQGANFAPRAGLRSFFSRA